MSGLSFALILLSSSLGQDSVRTTAEKFITAESVKPAIVELAADRYKGRGGGYSGERRAAEWIAARFRDIGLVSPKGVKGYLQTFEFMPHAPEKPWEKRRSQNVLGLLEGSDPVLKNEVVVIGAHYDGQGKAGQADGGPRGGKAENGDVIWNSANDNLSSVSAILSVAKALKEGGAKPRRSILFVAFGAEEHEMSGSIFYVNSPVFELSQHVAMINVECIGRMPDKPLMFNGAMTGAFWPATMKAANEQMGIQVQSNIPVPIPDSDHYPFASARIASVVVMGPADPDRHKISDTAEKIDFGRVAEAGRFCYAMLVDLASRDERPKFTQSIMPDLGMMADLATPAECDTLKLPPTEGCFRITGILPNRAAQRAGFKVGDVMVTMNGKPLKRDWTLPELEKMVEDMLRGKYGPEVKVTVLRDGKRLDLALPITTK